MNKQTLITILCICAVAGLAITIGYAMISNTITITPQITSLLLSTNSETPAVGDTVTLTLTLSEAVSGVPVTFYVNGTPTGPINTVSGVATLPVAITDLTVLTCYATIS